MTTFDVHTDKALKELHARLDQAERERDEARQHAQAAERDAVDAEARCAALTAARDEALAANAELQRRLTAAGAARARSERERDDTVRQAQGLMHQVGAESFNEASATITRVYDERREQAERLATEPARIAAAEMARDVAWVRACDEWVSGGYAVAQALHLFASQGFAVLRAAGARRERTASADADIAAAIRAARGAR